MSRKTSVPSVPEAGPDADLRGAPADGLERLLEGQHEADRPAGAGGP